VEVAEHFIGPPATEQANDVSIHLGHQKSHGARRAKAFRGDVQRGEAHKMGTNEGNGGPKGRSNVGRENVVPAAGVEVGSTGLVGWGIMGAEMKNAAGSGNNGAEVGWPERPRPITSPRTPLFWVSNSSVTKSALRRSASVAVCRWRGQPATLRETSRRRKGVDSAGLMVYSPGRSKKKKPSVIMSATAWLPVKLVAKAMEMA
jgi:hypothetical protein